MHFQYQNSTFPVSDAKIHAHRLAWEQLARPGNWWTGEERLAIVQCMRDARQCALCADRKGSLTPYASSSTGHSASHDGAASVLAPAVVDVVHRVTTDPARLTQTWLDGVIGGQFSAGHYVELLGVLVAAISIDTFHVAIGLPLEPLPEPVAGDPDGYLPPDACIDVAWVPMLTPATLTPRDGDIFMGAPETANVIRALSLVPDAVRLLHSLAAVHYVPIAEVRSLDSTGTLHLSRAQIELVAARTSAINDCFY